MEFRSKVAFGSLIFLLLIVFEVWVFSQQQPFKIKTLRKQLSLILAAVMFVCSVYIWKRFTALVQTKSILHIGMILKLILLVFLVLGQVAIVCVYMNIARDPPVLYFMATFSLGSIMLLSYCMIAYDICSYIFRKVACRNTRIPRSYDAMEVKIRSLLSLISGLALIVGGTWIVNSLAVEHVTVPLKGLDPRLNGTTIVQISDIHLGPFNGKSRLNSVVDKVNELRGDIVAITGDLVDASVADLREAVVPLKKLKAKYGVYYITGNHEYYTGDVDNWIAEMRKLNVTPLVNRRVCLPQKTQHQSCEKGLYLAGLEDLATRTLRYGTHSMDLHSALSGRTSGVPTVVLAHQPWAAAEAIMWDDVRLVLSGHTHAGQILPMMLLTYLYNPFFVGLYQPHPQVYVYVNPGTVYFLLPFRHYRPEITFLTLTSHS